MVGGQRGVGRGVVDLPHIQNPKRAAQANPINNNTLVSEGVLDPQLNVFGS
jgi:hypothetical protein